jgi:eukaryotic-like serine/threonine-protein kinase
MTSHLERLATRLSATYRLKSTLSSGAALDVYVADEWKTGRRVIIKALREEKATTTSAARFLGAITSASQLEHPNIVPLTALGTVDGLPYYITPVVDGVSLRTRVSAAASLPLYEVLQIASDIGAALDYAHRRRVLHRALRPEKVLLHNGRALVVDFDLEPAVGTVELPRRGLSAPSIESPEYTSPEQALGGAEIDGRSDVYSLACMVYEMIWGQPPFRGTPGLVLRRHASAEPMPLSCRLPGVPHGLSAAVQRALAKEPAHRFATAGAFAAALRDGCDSLEACRPSDIVITTAERAIERKSYSSYVARQSA